MNELFDGLWLASLSHLDKIDNPEVRSHCLNYTVSILLKYQFAQVRLDSLRKEISDYVAFQIASNWNRLDQDSIKVRYDIDMDFDHCILCLRSTLEHLAQLINAIVPLDLLPKGKLNEAVSLPNVIKELENMATKNDSHNFKKASWILTK